MIFFVFFFSSRRRHTRYWRDWSSDVCSSDLPIVGGEDEVRRHVDGGLRPRHQQWALHRGGISAPPLENGKAACGGKGEVSGGAGSFKKKKKNEGATESGRVQKRNRGKQGKTA